MMDFGGINIGGKLKDVEEIILWYIKPSAYGLVRLYTFKSRNYLLQYKRLSYAQCF